MKEKIPANAVFLGKRTFLFPNDITYLEADVNYTYVFTAMGKCKVLSTTLHKVLDCIGGHGNFVRISRKHVVNMDFVESKIDNGLVLFNGTSLSFSRRMNKKFINSQMGG